MSDSEGRNDESEMSSDESEMSSDENEVSDAEGDERGDAEGRNCRRRVSFVYKGRDGPKVPEDVTHVTVDPSVKSIQREAFFWCQQLVEVILNEGLEGIEEWAFGCCRSLMSMKVPSTVKVIGMHAFHGCFQLVEVELHEGLGQIVWGAFVYCKSLGSMKIPSTVKVIGGRAFCGCDQLVEVELNEGLEQIEGHAFESCKSLKRVKIPSTVNVIGGNGFGGCDQLVEVELNEGLKCIEQTAFHSCKSLKSIKIPSTVEVIHAGAFKGCKSLHSTFVPSTVKQVGCYAYNGCNELAAVVICGKHIEEEDVPPPFLQCWSLKDVPPPFLQCWSLRNVATLSEAKEGSDDYGYHDFLQLFGSHEATNNALRSRFDELPIHKLCYYQSCQSSEGVPEQIKKLIGLTPSQNGPFTNTSNIKGHNQDQDCLGMTPLHILACSEKQDLDLYQLIFSNHPQSLITKDKWGCLPVFYAVWRSAPIEIVQFLIDSQKSQFPNFAMNWEKMFGTLCRAGASLDIIENLLRIRQTSFPDHNIGLAKLAEELTIRCLVLFTGSDNANVRREDLSSFHLNWEQTIQCLTALQVHSELLRSMHQLRQNIISEESINWEWVRGVFFAPLVDLDLNQLGHRHEAFQFLAKYCISERLGAIGIRKWRMNTADIVVSGIQHEYEGYWSYYEIQSKLVACEQKYSWLKNAASLLELALWKSKLGELGGVEPTRAARNECRISCGADIILPNVLPYIIDDVQEQDLSDDDVSDY